MDIWGFIAIGYFLVGIILTYIWWHDEYEPEYEYEKENGDAEDSMTVILLLLFICFWPFKLVKNYFESLFY
ncbi:MAG: hypothetical protein VZR09_11160 [Candidatus Gastranaerophilaceae bacterium]|nr:hypothetical protein [Candidatus Gastranaerophilaceae bacterium]